jgi:isopentenyl-diphosphate delta-isomerase
MLSSQNNEKNLQNENELLTNIHSSQTKFLNDQLILVDEKDNNIGSISKLDGHLLSNKNKFPHRAFSIFLFDSKNRLLLQKRANIKVTFPLLWTNTCCSHPLNIESQNTPENINNALVKRIKYELGIDTDKNIYKLFDKILYRAPSNEKYEEFEIDYLFMAKFDKDSEDDEFIYSKNNLKKIINKNEVDDIKYETIENILNDMKLHPESYTPWFTIVMKNKGKFMDDVLKNKIELKDFDGEIKNFMD